MENKNYRFKGHESFVPREGWFTKALMEIAGPTGEGTFKEYYGADRLGVGPNMAKAIRYWLEAAGLIKITSGKSMLTKLGEAILEHDPYIENVFTLWILHLNLVMNKEKVTAWYLFFSEFEMESFTVDELKAVMSHMVQVKYGSAKTPSNSSVIADCDAILQMYGKERVGQLDPEEKKKSPFYELHLLRSDGESYRKMQPSKSQLDKLVIWYGINVSLEDNSASLDDLVAKPGQVGKSLNMKRSMMIEYIDLLADLKKITVNKTAGLDMIYLIERQKPEDIYIEYFNNKG